ncbi:MAG TPA: hypothetical protein VFU06_01450 [Longimicrobiales bacterium]|nr:hypothetical protein [Longimicrobiales bacterium]
MIDDARAGKARRDAQAPHWRRRPQELWDVQGEIYPGELALRDLETAPADDTITVLARHATLRVLVETAAGHPHSLRLARRAARMYLDAIPIGDARALRRLLRRRPLPPAALYRALADAGLAARAAGHTGGAYTLLRWAYEVARLQRRRRPAARVAAQLATLALADGAHRAARRWTRRVHALLGDDGVPDALASTYVQGMEKSPSAGGTFDAEQRRRIADSIAKGFVIACPVCQAPLTTSEVRPARGVPYVRRRTWVLCTGCRRTAAVDVPGRPPQSS